MAERSSSSESSSDSEVDRDFSYESYSDDNRDEAGQIMPYMYEPEVESDDDDGEHEIAGVDYDNEGRLNNINWCSCGECQIMPAVRESVCCKEINQVVQKMDNIEVDLNCITEHPGFYSVCLDQWVLETAYFQYRQQYGQGRHNATENQKNRHTAYRQMARWCWGFLGQNVRVPLPSCAVHKIREKYPSNEYRGFQEI